MTHKVDKCVDLLEMFGTVVESWFLRHPSDDFTREELYRILDDMHRLVDTIEDSVLPALRQEIEQVKIKIRESSHNASHDTEI
ncbi:MAG: hypothetical protein D6698_07395 [Gammaproteobacteria bacterium]|nr:MAG: hypothetical protein D6698_07395 [Gammaproteobacteria bacterium]